MKRPLRVYFDDADFERLAALARERSWSKSLAVRLAVRAFTSEPANDPVLELSGDIDGLPPDLSSRFLSETFAARGLNRAAVPPFADGLESLSRRSLLLATR